MAITNVDDLSERELEILALVATGASNKDIAGQLSISTNTVKVHLRKIFTKLQVSSRTEAALYAIKKGIAPGSAPSVQPAIEPEAVEDSQVVTELGLAPVPEVSVVRSKRPNWLAVGGLLFLISLIFLVWRLDVFSGGAIRGSKPVEWVELPPLAAARSDLALAFYGQTIYAIGGETPAGVIGVVEKLEISGRAWESLPAKPAPASEIKAAVVGGLVFVPGGKGVQGESLERLDIFDISSETWAEGPKMPLRTRAYSLAQLEGKIYVFGGWDGEKLLDSVMMYDPSTQAWKVLENLPDGRALAGAAVAGGKIYLLGGVGREGPLDHVDIFYPPNQAKPNGEWKTSGILPEVRQDFDALGLADMIFIVGGTDREGKPLPNWLFFPERGEWQEFNTPIETPWQDVGIVGSGTHIYCSGGRSGEEFLNDVFAFQAIYTASLPIVR